jgi:hypothetical protein
MFTKGNGMMIRNVRIKLLYSIDGKGKYKYANKDLYDGSWVNDKKEGEGVYTFK